ncbi:MAG: 3-deoxy-manno-octulosonate cytidylyltransferase [Candidatus Cloacimonetes bacterium]|nr:3-deoxy-manno-octulosonate cytidylyltransferase [Candidatus Cloacimonadota bacterium]
MKIVAIIPARYESSRFPGKLLAQLGNKPVIKHVFDGTKNSGLFDDIIVATDDQRIFETVDDFGGKVVLTAKEHQSGTDRIAEVCSKIDCDVIVNIQGDEPFISSEPLRKLVSVFDDKTIGIASLMHEIKKHIDNPNSVKVVCDKDNFALYFSRSLIPFNRDAEISHFQYLKHIGVYAFRKHILEKFVSLPEGKLEKIEKLEQLRLLENCIKIKMVQTEYEGIGIDTPEDLVRAELLLKKKMRISQY